MKSDTSDQIEFQVNQANMNITQELKPMPMNSEVQGGDEDHTIKNSILNIK